LDLAEHVRGDREVGEREEAGGGDPDAQDPGAAPVARCLDLLVDGPLEGGLRAGQAASSTGTASGPRRPSRSATAARRSRAWTSESGGRGCSRGPSSTPRGPGSEPATAARAAR